MKKNTVIEGAIFASSFLILYLLLISLSLDQHGLETTEVITEENGNKLSETMKKSDVVVIHLDTPEPLKAVYMTSWVAGDKVWRNSIVKMIEETELNAIVIDVKDYSGGISFKISNPLLDQIGTQENRIPDIKEFISELHQKGIYVIARISVFQDLKMVKTRADLAVKRASDGGVWRDYKGISWIDPGAQFVWDYVVEISKEAYAVGFDELNFDYIRFPSDGNMNDIKYPISGMRSKAQVLEEFFKYLKENLSSIDAKLSVDLFGMTTVSSNDLNIGQVLERAVPYFDYISPMVYPSHYPPHFNDYKNPNLVPYDVVKYSLDRAVARLIVADSIKLKMCVYIHSNSPIKEPSFNVGRILERALPKFGYLVPQQYQESYLSNFRIYYSTKPLLYEGEIIVSDKTDGKNDTVTVIHSKIRPWLQDFQYGGTYGPEEVRAQIQATYDAGLTSWMLWDPGVRYTREALYEE